MGKAEKVFLAQSLSEPRKSGLSLPGVGILSCKHTHRLKTKPARMNAEGSIMPKAYHGGSLGTDLHWRQACKSYVHSPIAASGKLMGNHGATMPKGLHWGSPGT